MIRLHVLHESCRTNRSTDPARRRDPDRVCSLRGHFLPPALQFLESRRSSVAIWRPWYETCNFHRRGRPDPGSRRTAMNAMLKKMIAGVLAAIGWLTLVLPGAAQQNEDAKFLTDAIRSDIAEMRLGELATQRGQ